MIKILYYGMGYNAGGIENYLLRIAQNLNKEKFSIGFINEQGNNLCYKRELEELGADLYPVTPRWVNPIKNKKEIKQLFTQNRFDIFHCNINTLSYAEPIFEALKNNCKVIVHSRNAGTNKRLITRMLHKIHFIRLKGKDVTRIAVSEKAGKWLFGEKEEFVVFNNGVNISKYTFNRDARNRIRKALNIEDRFVLGHVGTFFPTKNQKLVVQIINEMVNKKGLKNTVLLLVGEGRERILIENQVKEMGLEEHVFFLGIRTDIPDLLSAMDVFVFPSLYEGFPNVILEAQTNGLPCVISDTITSEILITDLVSVQSLSKSAEEWAERILQLKSKNNREYYATQMEEKGFSSDKECQKIEELYINALRKE